MMNDTPVFDAVRIDSVTGEKSWTGQVGTRRAISRDGLAIDPKSLTYCPHQWIDDRGYVDLALARRHPIPVAV